MEKVDFAEPLLFLNINGMHPNRNHRLARLKSAFCVLVYVVTILSGVLEIIFNWGLETWARASDTMIPQYQVLAKMLVLIHSREKVQQLLVHRQKFWPLSRFGPLHEKQLAAPHFYISRFFRFYKYAVGFTCVQFLVVKLLTRNPIPLCISFREQEEHGPIYDYSYLVLHATGTLLGVTVLAGFDGLFFYFIGHILSELEMVKIAFGNYEVLKLSDDRRKFRIIAKHHSEVMGFIKKFNDVFCNVFLVQHLSSLFGICFGLFLMSRDGLPPSFDVASKYMPYIISFTLQTWTFCFAGHLVYDWSSQIPIEIFYNGWDTNYDYENVRGRVLAIFRGQQAAQLTLGAFGNLNLESFKLVIQKAFSFLAFINTMMEKNFEE